MTATAPAAGGEIAINAGHVALAALLLLLPAMLAGHPFIFVDSGNYFNLGRHIVSEAQVALGVDGARIILLDRAEAEYAAARAPVYSLFTFLATNAANLWGLAYIQALCLAYAVMAFTGSLAARPARPLFWVLIALATAATSAPYYVAYAMPDVFVGIGLLAAISLLLSWRRLARSRAAMLWALLALSASSHATTAIAMLLAACLGLGLLLAAGERARLAGLAACLLSAVGLGALAGPAYRVLDTRVIGHQLDAPPFITARLLADGTGLAWLDSACAHAKPHPLCGWRFRPPVDSDVFLWGKDGPNAVFQVAPPQMRQALRDSEWRLISGTVLHDPAAQAAATLRNWGRQLRMSQVVEPLDEPRSQPGYEQFVRFNPSLEAARELHLPAALHSLMALVHWSGVFGLVIVWIWRGRLFAGDCAAARRMAVAVALLLVILLANAALCGAVSMPHYRYEARLIWVYPLALAAILANCGPLRPLAGDRLGTRLRNRG